MQGYGIDVDWDGETLRVRGKNKAARIALAGQDHEQDVVLQRADITGVAFRTANIARNGRVTVQSDGKTYKLNFLKKHQEEFRTLAQDLGWRE